MAIYIDGFNFLKSKGFSGDKLSQMEQLLNYVSKVYSKSEVVHIAFDGFKTSIRNEFDFIKIHFSGSKSADDLLVELVKKKKSPQTVVTSDNELRSRLLLLGAKVKKTNELKIEKPKKNNEKSIPFDSHLFDELYLLNNKGKL